VVDFIGEAAMPVFGGYLVSALIRTGNENNENRNE
jgi:hypothetical protein